MITTLSALSAEDRLVLYLLSRSWLDDARVAAIKSVLTDRVDWDSILQSATRHGIAPLLYRTLSRIDDASAVPPEVRAKLRTAYYKNIARNMLLYQELHTVLKAFKAAGIDAIVLKGAFLAEIVYENIGLRAIGDIDLLVKKDDLGKVKQVLIQLEYHALPTRWGERLNELWETEWAEERHFTKANNADIDVH
jgi:phosphoglycolate phosphatase-like HAD superfamily hydrolase